MKNGRKFALLLPFAPILLGIIGLFFFNRQPGFSVQKISSELPFAAEWECGIPADNDLEQILLQPYTYLGNGAQCFAFESADGKYVLKFFKMKHLLPDKLANYLYFGKYKNRNERHRERLQETFLACKMAYEELREETGLIYVHINPTSFLKHKVLLRDKQGKESLVDLDKTVFLLQHKAEMIYKRIGCMIKQGDLVGAKKAFDSVTDLVKERSRKGFKDNDTSISRNYGFVGKRPIHLDFLRVERSSDPEEPARIEEKMLGWFDKHYPEANLSSIAICSESSG